jgi:lysophospholipase L1-like esterase
MRTAFCNLVRSQIGSRMKKTIFYAMGIALIVAAAVGGDVLVGRITHIGEVRIAARQFREEAGPLQLSTKNLVPLIDHTYFDTLAQASGGASNEFRRLRTNQNGFIVSGRTDPFGSRKIIFVGGSTTECNEVQEESRFPAVVERILQGNGQHVVAMNAGVRGHTTQDSINLLLNHPGFRDDDVDSIVLMHNINDRLWLALRGNYNGSLALYGPTTSRAMSNSALSLIGSAVDYAAYRSNAVFLMQFWSNKGAAWLDRKPKAEVTEMLDDRIDDAALTKVPLFERNLLVFIRVVQGLGKRPILMTQALGYPSASQDLYNDAVRHVADAEHITIIDLERQLGSNPKWAFFADNIHLNRDGSEAVGAHIAKVMGPMFEGSLSKN